MQGISLSKCNSSMVGRNEQEHTNLVSFATPPMFKQPVTLGDLFFMLSTKLTLFSVCSLENGVDKYSSETP